MSRRLIKALGGNIETGMCRCPAHDDREPSLHVSEREGKILVKCHAGCSQDEVIAALKARGIWQPSRRKSSLSASSQNNNNLYEEARVRARRMWDAAAKASDSFQYCRRKQVTPRGLRIYQFKNGDRVLLVPVRDEGGKLQSLQQITPSGGSKKFLKGSRTRGGHFWIAKPENAEVTICVCEGWATGASIHEATGHPVLIAFSAGNLRAVAEWLREKYPDAEIIVCADDDHRSKGNPGVTAANDAARAVDGKVAVPDFGEHRDEGDKDFNDLLVAHGPDAVREAIDAATEPSEVADEATEACDDSESKRQADRLVQLAAEAELFHTPDEGKAFADIRINGHRETCAVNSSGFKSWLTRAYYNETKTAPNPAAFSSALAVLNAKARYDGPARNVALRVAGHDGKTYIDLCDSDWRVIEIDQQGWRLANDPPIRFIRRRGMKPLPTPVKGGKAWRLKQYVNVKRRSDFILLLSWLLAALNPRGPFPVLDVTGEAGSAKSTLLALVRSLIDPNKSELRAPPREEGDLFISAGNAWVPTFDNLSTCPDWLSDAFARLSTGGGFAKRQLYTDDEESLFEAQRPILLGAIASVIKRGDLADRVISLRLEPIADTDRRNERELAAAFERDRPAILGALLKAVARGLRRLPQVQAQPGPRPRLADFYNWAAACGDGLLWKEGEFASAYAANRLGITADVVEADLVGNAIETFMHARRRRGELEWSGTATQLLDLLESQIGERQAQHKSWPSSAAVLGKTLPRIATPLRRLGLEIETERAHGGKRVVRIRWSENVEGGNLPSPLSPPHDQHEGNDNENNALSGGVTGDRGDSKTHTFNSPESSRSSSKKGEFTYRPAKLRKGSN